MSACVLQQWSPRWGLPSLSPACTTVQAYMRFADMGFTLENYENASSAPSGVLPTLDTGDALIGPSANVSEQLVDGLDATANILAHLAKVKNLDAALGPKDLGEMHAFSALVTAKLIPATVYFTFLDPVGYKRHTQEAYAATLPVPMNYINPWKWRSGLMKKWGSLTSKSVLEGVEIVYAALATHVEDSEFFCGSKPTSLDAVLYAHLHFHYHAPVCENDLRPLMKKHPALCRYVENISETYFKSAPRPPPTIELSQEERAEVEATRAAHECATWSEWLWGAKKDAPPKKPRSEKELRFKRRGQMFMAFMASAVVAYTMLLGVVEIYEDDVDSDDED